MANQKSSDATVNIAHDTKQINRVVIDDRSLPTECTGTAATPLLQLIDVQVHCLTFPHCYSYSSPVASASDHHKVMRLYYVTRSAEFCILKELKVITVLEISYRRTEDRLFGTRIKNSEEFAFALRRNWK